MPMWCNYTGSMYRKMKVAYNNVFRSLFTYDYRASASYMFVSNNVLNFDALVRKSIFDFRCRLHQSKNRILTAIFNNFYVRSNVLFNHWCHSLYVLT